MRGRTAMGVAGALTLALAIGLPAAVAGEIRFDDARQLAGGAAYARSLVADVTGDGLPDVLLTGGAAPALIVGREDGTIGPATAIGQAGDLSSGPVAVGDMNRDGIMDIVVAISNGSYGRILYGDGAGGFNAVEAWSPSTTTTVGALALADLDGNGVPEIVADARQCSITEKPMIVLRRNAAGGYDNVPQTGTYGGINPAAIAVADIDEDGLVDVVAGGGPDGGEGAYGCGAMPPFGPPELRVLWGNGSADLGASPPPARFNLGTLFDVAVGDLDGDGRPEVVVAAALSAGGVRVFRNNGGRSMTLLPGTTTGFQALSLALARLDDDGTLDLVAGGLTSPSVQPVVHVLRGVGDGTFATAQVILSGQPYDYLGFSVAAGDVDTDGRPDVITNLAPWAKPYPAFFLNQTTFAPPGASTGAADGVTRSAAQLAGSAATAGRRGSAWFEYGPTASYGSSTAQTPLPRLQAAQSVGAALANLEPDVVYHYRLVVRTPAGGTAAGADATFRTLDTVRLTRAALHATYRLGKAQGVLEVSGRAPAGRSAVTFVLVRRTKSSAPRIRAYRVTLPAGAFRRRLALPTTILPGAYAVQAEGPAPVRPARRDLRLMAPAEGVVARAWASARPGGPVRQRVPARRAYANFAFGALPDRGPIVARWIAPGGSRAVQQTMRAGKRLVSAAIDLRAAKPGRWRCELLVRGKLVAVATVRVE